MAYKLKVWRLPEARSRAAARRWSICCRCRKGERITTVLPLPEDEAEWEKLNVVFATKSGDVRRNELSDFASINRNGKIAMKLEAATASSACRPAPSATILLTTRLGKCIRFAIGDVRVFKGRDSTGVRGIKLAAGDEVVSLSLLHHSDATTAEARAYLKQASAARRAAFGEDGEAVVEDVADDEEAGGEEATLTRSAMRNWARKEQFVLAVSENGFGKRTSSYEYRVTGRGGSGIVAMDMGEEHRHRGGLPGRGIRRSDADQRPGPDHPRGRSPASAFSAAVRGRDRVPRGRGRTRGVGRAHRRRRPARPAPEEGDRNGHETHWALSGYVRSRDAWAISTSSSGR
jgi:DNA gyrase subunit A